MPGSVRVDYSKKFLRQLERLPKRIVDLAQEKEVIFRENSFDPRLDTHKLHGKEKEVWAFSVTHRCRIKFLFLPGGGVLFLEIGRHDIYR